IAALDAEIQVKEREMQTCSMEEPTEFELRRLRTAFRERLGRFDEFLRADIPLARQALQKLIPERIEFRPETVDGERKYHLGWACAVKPLTGEGYLSVATPRGFDPWLPP